MSTVDFVLLDVSNGATTTSGQAMDATTFAAIAAVCEIQLNRDYAAHHGGAFRVRAGASSTDIQAGEEPFYLRATLDVPGAIADHSVLPDGTPVLEDGISLSDTLIGPGNSVSCAISHELLETAKDPAIDIWADDGTKEHAVESCDAVESTTYEINGIHVSNFLTQAWFAANHAGPYDFVSTLGPNPDAPTAPFMTAPGGYQVERDSGTHEVQVTAMIPITLSATVTLPFGHSLRRPMHPSSRRAARIAKAAA